MSSLEDLYRIYLGHPLISTDSRNIQHDGLFFALKGDNFNGNLFAAKAVENGAAFAVVDDPGLPKDPRYIIVDDVLETLQKLASFHRDHLSIPVIAVTGSNGKTTTKELIHAVLSEKYKTTATRSNLNNHIGVPLTLLSITPETEIAIIEMGANHPGEIRFLCELVKPDHGIITNIGKAHLEGFGSFKGVVNAKTELYNWLKAHEGVAFVNAGNQLLMNRSAGIKKFTYGTDLQAGYQLRLIDDSTMVIFGIGPPAHSIVLQSRLYGSYNIENLAAAAAIGSYFNIGDDKIKSAIENYIPANNRSEIRQTKSNRLILDAYNANPSSMEAAIENFSLTTWSNKTVILGDMLELGSESESEHLHILKLLEEKNFTGIYLVGPVFTKLCTKNEWTCFQDSGLARLWFEHHKMEGATILIKGSRGIHMEQIAEVL